MRFNSKTLFVITFVIILGIALVLPFYNINFLTKEDGIVEYASAFFWLVGIWLSLRILVYRNLKRTLLIYILLFVCIIGFGEELSWGQRIFNFETPAYIANVNKQGEVNIHNLYFLSGGSRWLDFFKTGHFDKYQILDLQNIFRIGFFTLFFIFPLIYKFRFGKVILSRIGYYHPGREYIILILTFMIISCSSTFLISFDSLHSLQEIREMSFALFISLYLFNYFYSFRYINH
jgi:hypothetical protein